MTLSVPGSSSLLLSSSLVLIPSATYLCSSVSSHTLILKINSSLGLGVRDWGSSYLVGQGVDSLLQVVVLRVQQRRLFSLKGAVGVGVLSKLADHGELWN